jgi:hypothetical protein
LGALSDRPDHEIAFAVANLTSGAVDHAMTPAQSKGGQQERCAAREKAKSFHSESFKVMLIWRLAVWQLYGGVSNWLTRASLGSAVRGIELQRNVL